MLSAMPQLKLGPLLRYVDDTSATVWVETTAACTVSVLDVDTPTFSICGHHYALVIVEGLEPGSSHEYEVRLDGVRVWPEPGAMMPPSLIRTLRPNQPAKIILGSCRAAAPHEPPYTLERAFDPEGRGVDTLWAHALELRDVHPEKWPDLLLFVGDQVYADDTSPEARDRIETLRGPDSELPPELVANYEEYTWLYREAWSLPTERWLLSTVASAMVFDDHDMIDDWNISESWANEMRAEPWWHDHAVGGLMSYWVYQHLGNLSPAQIRAEGLLDQICAAGDGTAILEDWANSLDSIVEETRTYRFSFTRQVGDVTVVVVDCRYGRVVRGTTRLMVGPAEWAWIREQVLAARGHVVLATTMPVFIADGLHDFQVWSERVCAGAWGARAARWGERVRRSLDLEDWSAFATSYRDFVDLVREAAGAEPPPHSVVIASGDIHFTYAARVPLADVAAPVWQVVSSPMRNALIPPERGVMRLTLTRAGRRIGAVLRRLVRAPETRPGIDVVTGPLFANNLCELRYEGPRAELSVEHSAPDGDGQPDLTALPPVVLT
jgi:hypothetical protein